MDDGFKNLIFLVVALAAWGIKAAMERKEGRGKPRRPRPAATPEGAESEGATGEVDVVYERRRLSPQITALPEARAVAPLASAPLASARLETAGAPRSPPPSTGSGGRLTQIGDKGLETTLQASDAVGAHKGVHVKRAHRAWKRLGVEQNARARVALRTAVLWREVLGAPRALRGPHRPPTRSRRPA